MAHNFWEDKKEGKYGEYLVKKYWNEYFSSITEYAEDKSENPDYQKADIDLIVQYKQDKQRIIQTLEVKTDSTLYPNLFYETVSTSNQNGVETPGCMITSEADVLLYVYSALDVMVVVELKQLREWVRSHFVLGGHFNEKNVKNSTYDAKGYAIPIEMLVGAHGGCAGVPGLMLRDMNTNQHLSFEEYEARRQVMEDLLNSKRTNLVKQKGWDTLNKKIWPDYNRLNVAVMSDKERYKAGMEELEHYEDALIALA